jgi:hypothetical protein
MPGEDAEETIEIADALMIDAITAIQKALEKSRPQPGKLRLYMTLGTVALVLAVAVFWLPGALTRQTLAVVPLAKRMEIGATLLTYMEDTTGTACHEPRADAAAITLARRLFGNDTRSRIVVVPQLDQGALAIPGQLILLDYRLLQQADDPAAVAGFIIVSRAKTGGTDPLETLLHHAGLSVTFRMLTTGEIPAEVLQESAHVTLNATIPTLNNAAVHNAFSAAQIPLVPYLTLLDQATGNMPDIGPDPLEGQTLPAIMTDSAWVSLQNICNI